MGKLRVSMEYLYTPESDTVESNISTIQQLIASTDRRMVGVQNNMFLWDLKCSMGKYIDKASKIRNALEAFQQQPGTGSTFFVWFTDEEEEDIKFYGEVQYEFKRYCNEEHDISQHQFNHLERDEENRLKGAFLETCALSGQRVKFVKVV